MINQKYNLSIIPDKVKPIVRVSQYDDSSRTIIFNIDDTFTTAKVKIGDTEINGTVNGNEVSFLVTEDLTQDYGIKEGEVICDTIGTLNFYFEVDFTPLESDYDVVLGNRALSIIFGREVRTNTPYDALNILFGGEQ